MGHLKRKKNNRREMKKKLMRGRGMTRTIVQEIHLAYQQKRHNK
jgi:hypothetical protein